MEIPKAAWLANPTSPGELDAAGPSPRSTPPLSDAEGGNALSGSLLGTVFRISY